MQVMSKMRLVSSADDIPTIETEPPGQGGWRGALAVRPRARGRAAVLGLLACGAVWALPPDQAVWRDQTASVLELLKEDTRRALEQEGLADRQRPADAPARAVPPAADTLRLAALYGTAGQLTAVLYVNGVRKEYRPGASLPYGGAGAVREYRLQRVLDSCVVVRKAGVARIRSVCFEPVADPALVAMPAEAAALDSPLPRGGMAR